MADSRDKITIYTQQSAAVLDAVLRDGEAFCSMDYVRRKYAESAKVFEAAYGWFIREAPKLLSKPEGAGTPYWAFLKPEDAGGSGEGLITLTPPASEVILFDMYDWNRILKLSFLGEDEREEKDFRRELSERGIKNESDVLLTNFHPELKARVQQSWTRLFRHHERLLAGDMSGVGAVQAAVWSIKAEWIKVSE